MIRTACVIGILLASGWSALGQVTTTWSGPPFGDWFTPGHWSNGLPGDTTSAVIDTGFANIAASTTEALAFSLVVGATNTGAVTGLGLTQNDLSVSSFTAGRDAGSDGLITMSNGQIQTFGTARIGGSGKGSLLVGTGGTFLNAGIVVGDSTGSRGTVEVNGVGSELRFFSPTEGTGLVVGNDGTGEMALRNGGRLTRNTDVDLIVGAGAGSGRVVVTGVGSGMNVYELTARTASFEVLSGGTVVVDEGIVLGGTSVEKESAFRVVGAGSSVAAETLRIGTTAGKGTFTVDDGGLLEIEFDLNLGGLIEAELIIRNATVESNSVSALAGFAASIEIAAGGLLSADAITLSDQSRLAFTLAGTSPSQFGRLMTESISLNGIFSVELSGGFVPTFGDEFSLLTFTTATGGFDTLDLPVLGTGLSWDASNFGSTGKISVVPEPATTGLFVLALVGFVVASRLQKGKNRQSA